MARVEALCAEPALGASPLAGSEVAVSLAQGAVACYDASTNTPTRTWQLPSGRTLSAPAVRSGRVLFAPLAPTPSLHAAVIAWPVSGGPRAALEATPIDAIGLGRRPADGAARGSDAFPAISDVIPTGADAVAVVLSDGTLALVCVELSGRETSASLRAFAPPLTSTLTAFVPVACSPRVSRSGELAVVGLAHGAAAPISAVVVWSLDLEARSAAPERAVVLSSARWGDEQDDSGAAPAALCVSSSSPASVAAVSSSGESLALWKLPPEEDRAALADADAALEPFALARLPTRLVAAATPADARTPRARGKRSAAQVDAGVFGGKTTIPAAAIRMADLGGGALAVLGRVPLEGQAPLFLIADWSLGVASGGPVLSPSSSVPRPTALRPGSVALASREGVSVASIAAQGFPRGVLGLLTDVSAPRLVRRAPPAPRVSVATAALAEGAGSSSTTAPPVAAVAVSAAERSSVRAVGPEAILETALAAPAARPPSGAALAAAARLGRWDDAAVLLARSPPLSLAGCPGAARAAAEAGRLDVLWKLLAAQAPDLEPEELAAVVEAAFAAVDGSARADPSASRSSSSSRASSSASAQAGPSSSLLLEASRQARVSARQAATEALVEAEDCSAAPAARRAAARRALAARAAAGRGDRDPALHALLGAAVEEAPLRAAARALPPSIVLRLVRRVSRELRDAERDAQAAAVLGLPDGAARGRAAARAAGLPTALPPAPEASRLLAWASALLDAHLVALSVSSSAEPALRAAAEAVDRRLARLRGAAELSSLLGGLAAAAAPLDAAQAAKARDRAAESNYALYWLDLSVGGQ